jgi:hypothetical protein
VADGWKRHAPCTGGGVVGWCEAAAGGMGAANGSAQAAAEEEGGASGVE